MADNDGDVTELYAEIGSIRSDIQGLGRSFDRFAEATSKRIEIIEEKVNTPFPMWQMFGAFTGFSLIIGALVSFALAPIYESTNLNRQSLQALSNIISADVKSIRKELDNEVDDTREKSYNRIDNVFADIRHDFKSELDSVGKLDREAHNRHSDRINRLEEAVATMKGGEDGLKLVQSINDRAIQRLERALFNSIPPKGG